MEFDYIAARYRKNSDRGDAEKILGGFLNLESAKSFIEKVEFNFLSNGFMYIDSPVGRYIYGEKGYFENGKKWYSPEEIKDVIFYDSHRDECVNIGDYFPIHEYYNFIKTSQRKDSQSVIEKLQSNKNAVDRKSSVRGEVNVHEKTSEYTL